MRRHFDIDDEVYFTSDLHFGHKAMCSRGWRPFTDVSEMDTALIRNWNDAITKYTHVFILGDISFHGAQRTVEIFSELNGIKHLILGNHDAHLSKYVFDVFEDVAPYHEIQWLGQLFTLCHYPLRSWNQMHYGSWNLHGHTHGNVKDKWRRQVDVGTDCWAYSPVSIETIVNSPQPERIDFCDHHKDKPT